MFWRSWRIAPFGAPLSYAINVHETGLMCTKNGVFGNYDLLGIGRRTELADNTDFPGSWVSGSVHSASTLRTAGEPEMALPCATRNADYPARNDTNPTMAIANRTYAPILIVRLPGPASLGSSTRVETRQMKLIAKKKPVTSQVTRTPNIGVCLISKGMWISTKYPTISIGIQAVNVYRAAGIFDRVPSCSATRTVDPSYRCKQRSDYNREDS
jgi:hypothetical protein